MTVTIDLPPEDEQKLASRAATLGQDVAGYLRGLVRQDLDAPPPVPVMPPRPNQASLDLLAQWDEEDATDDPAEIERRARDWEVLKQNLNRNREEVGARKIFP